MQLALQIPLPPTDIAKRWRDGEQRWVHQHEYADLSTLSVRKINEKDARSFLTDHHYLSGFPATRLCIGLFNGRQLAGAIVFGVPSNNATLTKWLGSPSHDLGCALSRLAIHDSVKFNAESWFSARAIALLLAEKKIGRIVSFADPVERTTDGGIVKKRPHWGTTYQGLGAILAGRSKPKSILVDRDGYDLEPRMISKLVAGDQGEDYARKRLEEAIGPLQDGESPQQWLARGIEQGALRKVKHPGNLAYTIAATRADRRHLRLLHGSGLPYPKRRTEKPPRCAA